MSALCQTAGKKDPKKDNVMTPPDLARIIVDHFRPSGALLDPCCGERAFANALIGYGHVEAFDISEGPGGDFLKFDGAADWIITNPPWSKLRKFRNKAMQTADNIVFLCSAPTWFYTATRREMKQRGFGLVELLYVPTPKKPWPQSGFALAAGWMRRGWTGPIHHNQSLMP